MEQMEIVSKVDEPTEWCAGVVVVPKANGKVRICVDLTKLKHEDTLYKGRYLRYLENSCHSTVVAYGPL